MEHEEEKGHEFDEDDINTNISQINFDILKKIEKENM